MKKLLIIAALATTPVFADVELNGEPTGVSRGDAAEAFNRLGEAMGAAADRAERGQREIEVRAPNTRDIDPPEREKPEPAETEFDY